MPRILVMVLIAGVGLGGAGCSQQELADSVARRAAASVVLPVMQQDMTAPQAQRATDCILGNADASEVQALARDVAVVAGTLTVANIRAIALGPATQACFADNGVPPVMP